jgi:hypothetical protein
MFLLWAKDHEAFNYIYLIYGDFVSMKLHDPNLVFIWMGRAQVDVVKAKKVEFFKMVRIEWWVFMKKGVNLDELHLYEDC